MKSKLRYLRIIRNQSFKFGQVGLVAEENVYADKQTDVGSDDWINISSP